ncbi:MAG: glycosyltransferase family 1 protein [bacterium]|nr:glycosyltransferase family 1 protein [bacterium]
MRILIDVRLLVTGKTSGIEEYARSLIDALLMEGKDEIGLFYNGLRKAPLPERWRKNPRITVLNGRLPNKLFDILARTLGLPDIERDFHPDVVFSPHFNILPRTRAPRVITFHDLSFLHYPELFGFRQRVWHWLQNYRAQALEADRIVAVSEFTKSDLINLLGIPEERIRVVYSGVSDIFQPQKEEAVAEFRARHGLARPFLLYLGTIEPRKNLRAVIRAFNLLKEERAFADLELVLAGPRGWLYAEILGEAHDSPFKGNIRFFGQVRSEERPLLYAAAALFIYPSFFEGFGFPPLEAQACGTPAVVSNRTSLPEIFGDSVALVDPWRIEEIADAAHRLLADESARRATMEAGLKNAARFRWPRAAEKMRKIFAELV